MVPLVFRNVPTTILVRPPAIMEYSVVSVASIKRRFVTVIDWYYSLNQSSWRPSEGVGRGELLPHSLLAVAYVHEGLS